MEEGVFPSGMRMIWLYCTTVERKLNGSTLSYYHKFLTVTSMISTTFRSRIVTSDLMIWYVSCMHRNCLWYHVEYCNSMLSIVTIYICLKYENYGLQYLNRMLLFLGKIKTWLFPLGNAFFYYCFNFNPSSWINFYWRWSFERYCYAKLVWQDLIYNLIIIIYFRKSV